MSCHYVTQNYLKSDVNLLDQRQRTLGSMDAVYMYCAAEAWGIIVKGLGLLDSVADTHSVLAGVCWQRNAQLSHHLLHDFITFGMDDKISLVVFRCLLQVDDHKLASCMHMVTS